ncbi:MAG: hypothetical protein RLZZ399_2817 [Verrucomicrobiota bacterium]|jgi:acetyl esterase/lipase
MQVHFMTCGKWSRRWVDTGRTSDRIFIKKHKRLNMNVVWKISSLGLRGFYAGSLIGGTKIAAENTSAIADGTIRPAQNAATKREGKPGPVLPAPTASNVAYGPHPKQVLDFWRSPKAQGLTPVVFYIHGGGWRGGDRSHVSAILKPLLAAGVSVVSISYRFIPEADAEHVEPPVMAPMRDAARALQLVRSKAAEWQIDKTRIAAAGFSAGACTSLWLAFHDDMADPKSEDPVARESTRLLGAAVGGAQTSLDPTQMQEWIPNIGYGGHAFGYSTFAAFLSGREKILPWINEYSPYALVTPDDPPIHLWYRRAPALGQNQQDPTHSANFGVKLKEKLDEKGVRCELVHAEVQDAPHPSSVDFLLSLLFEDEVIGQRPQYGAQGSERFAFLREARPLPY